MTFYVGQRVVYIANGIFKEWHRLGLSTPVKNSIYTIREFTDFDLPGLRLVEIRNPPIHTRNGLEEVCWYRDEFRPLVKTDISVFQKLLVPNKQREKA